MQNTNITTGSIWSFNDSSSLNAIKLSMPEVLCSDLPLSHFPTPGYLAPIQHELLSSILQVIVDTIWPKGLPKKLHKELINSNHLPPVRSAIDKICEQLEKQKGFNLCGNGAFLQMPTAWRTVGKEALICELIWPFSQKTQGEAKGLRRLAMVPGQLGPDLTALYLFSTCILSRSGSQYWSSGNLANRTLIHQYHGRTLRQHLFQAIMPGNSPYWKPLQPLPWVPHCMNNGGLETNDKPPFAKYFTGKQQIQGTANLRFFQSRAIILDPPDQGVCDITGAHTSVFRSFRLLIDRTVHQQLKQCCNLPKGCKIAGILSTMYSDHEHPSATRPIQQDIQKKYDDLPHYGYTKPYWSISNESLQHSSVVIQSTTSGNNDRSLSAISLFKVNYAKKNQDPRGIFIHQNGYAHLRSPEQADKINVLRETATKSIQEIRTGLWILLIPNNKKRLPKTDQACHDSWLLTCKHHLWQTADALFHATDDIESLDNWKFRITRQFQQAKSLLWRQILEDCQDVRSMRIKEHYKEFIATKRVLGDDPMFTDLPYLDSKPVVRAGRAFVQTYHNLTNVERNLLIQAGDRPFVHRQFWDCMRSAEKEDPDAYQPMYEGILPLLKFITPQKDGKNLGEILSVKIKPAQSNRVDQLLTETSTSSLLEELLVLLQYLTKDGRFPIPLDVGILCDDLRQYHFNRDTVIRRWARQYFFSQEDKKEQKHV